MLIKSPTELSVLCLEEAFTTATHGAKAEQLLGREAVATEPAKV